LKSIVVWVLLSSFVLNLCLPLSLFAIEPSLPSSSITIISNTDGATVHIDASKVTLVTPITEPLLVEPGYHMIRVEKEGFTTWRKDMIVSPGEQMTIEAILLPIEVTDAQKKAFKNMDKKPINKRWWFWVIVLAAVGAAIAGETADDDATGSVAISW